MHEFFTVDYEYKFPISRDPPEGGTKWVLRKFATEYEEFPISRNPPEGGTRHSGRRGDHLGTVSNF